MILNNNNKNAKTPVKSAALPLSDIHKKEISIRLKSVDKLIKDGNLDEAIVKLEAVKAMDPKNGYIHALEERIEELRKAKDNPQSVESTEVSDKSAARNESERKVETEYLEKLSEEVHKLEERLESEYRDRFTDEISRSDGRILQALKEERERHDAEIAALRENFDKEKEDLMKELKKETRHLFDVEFKKAEDSYRKLLADMVRRTEEESRAKMSSMYEKVIAGLKDAVEKDRSQLLDVERKTIIEQTRKQTQDELRKRFLNEIAKVKTAVASSNEEHEIENVPVLGDAGEKSEAALKQVERKMETRVGEPQKTSEERYRKSAQEIRDVPDKRIAEVKQDDPKNTTGSESKLEDLPKTNTELGIKTEEQLARERELRDQLLQKEFQNIRNGVDWKDRPRKGKG